jgi:EAL domain-containing protein (putative c-di-GMP-specific phosphodiesterase class I)
MCVFLAAAGALSDVTGVDRWVGRVIGGGQEAGVSADVFAALAVCWIPLCVIDYRRCNREIALRAQVEAELEREAAASRARLDELGAPRVAATGVLDRGGPRIVYQPIVEMATGAIVGYEALSRFDDGTPPDRWFAHASRVDLGVELELAAAAAALDGCEALPADAYLSINVGPRTLCDPRLLELVTTSVPARVVLELTEHLAVDDYREYRASVAQMRAHGVRVAVDDAGAGYASFRHIVDVKPDIIKVDGSLVHGVHLDPSRRSLMIAFVTFAADLGASLVAECVELGAEAEALGGWGVGFGQGWFFGRPKPQPSAVRCVPIAGGTS